MAANCKASGRQLFSVSRLQSILIQVTGSRCNSIMAVKDPKIYNVLRAIVSMNGNNGC